MIIIGGRLVKKEVVCLANSRKAGGRCFAGKDINSKSWLRPVSDRDSEALDKSEMCIKDNNCECLICDPILPDLLDVIEIDLGEYIGKDHQTENYLIGPKKWRKVGRIKKEAIDYFLDPKDLDLWGIGYQGRQRLNDRLPVSKGGLLINSLILIEVKSLVLNVVNEPADIGYYKKKVNGKFYYNDEKYILPVTDGVVENQYLLSALGVYEFEPFNRRIILCLSIGKAFLGYYYKFISGIMRV